MKVLFLIPPSEWKNSWWERSESLSFVFKKPLEIAKNATEKDLKCQWRRYEEAIILNIDIWNNTCLEAIERYSGVMYNAIDYAGMNENWKIFFEESFCILSWMYGLLKPRDQIGNYKLPIETKGLYAFWWDQITEALSQTDVDIIVNLLPNAYLKMIQEKKLNKTLVNINFLTEKNGKRVKIAHGVKKVKWEWIKKICENTITDYNSFWWEVIKKDNTHIDINIFYSP